MPGGDCPGREQQPHDSAGRREPRETSETCAGVQSRPARTNPSIFGKSPQHVVARAVASVGTGHRRPVGSPPSEGSVWVFGLDISSCVAKSQLQHSHDLRQASGCELCMVRPCPRGQRGTAVTRMSLAAPRVAAEALDEVTGGWGGPPRSWRVASCGGAEGVPPDVQTSCFGCGGGY